jgi:hypothetical protein
MSSEFSIPDLSSYRDRPRRAAAVGASRGEARGDEMRRRPGPKPRTRSFDRATLRSDAASVARAWFEASYEDLRRGGPDRAVGVEHVVETYLIPWFAPRTATIGDVTHRMAHDWVIYLVGRARRVEPRIGRRTPSPQMLKAISRHEELSLVDAAALCGVSVATARRRWRTGQLPGAHRDARGRIRVPAAALVASGTSRQTMVGLSHRYVANALWVLRQVLAFARANGLVPPGFDPTEGLTAPTPDAAYAHTPPPTGRPRPLTLPECARIAAHLHVPHQLVLWLQRIMGLRISEAFGVLVGDIVDLGAEGMLEVQRQGGRLFKVRTDDGSVASVPDKTMTKTAAGTRVLVVPPALMELIRVAIEAFHTDPVSGRIDRAARLVPGVQRADRGGSNSYQTAFIAATEAEGLSSNDLGFRVSNHLLRKSLATDLAWETSLDGAVCRRFMGHRAGEDVFGRIYSLDHLAMAPFQKVAEVLQGNIEGTIGSLLVLTTRTVQWGRKNPLSDRAEHVDAVLRATGWLVDPGAVDDPLCRSERVADELDIFVTTARRWMADGTLPTVHAPDAQGVPRRWCQLGAVRARRDQLARRHPLPDVAAELGLPYHELYQMVRRLGLRLDRRPGSQEYEVDDEAVATLRAERKRVRALHRRSMKLTAAAYKLSLARSTVGLLVRRGELTLDPETDSSGAQFVTAASVRRYQAIHARILEGLGAEAAMPITSDR